MSQLWDALRDAARACGYELVEHSYWSTDSEGYEQHSVWIGPIHQEVQPDERS